MADRPIYSMSQAGGCPRAVVAIRLGYDTVSPPEFMERAAREGTRHESWVAEDLREHGWQALPPEFCEHCKRDGLHVELEFAAYRLIGHIDRVAEPMFSSEWPPPRWLVEIKSLGRFRAEKLDRALTHGTFREEFFELAFQVSCYHHACKLPILYAVKNRDTGSLRTFDIKPPFSLEEIDNHILELEIMARKGVLPPCRHKRGDFERLICPVKYMCAGEDEEAEETPDMPGEGALADAAIRWRRAKEAQKNVELEIEHAQVVFMKAVKALEQRVFHTNGLKITYIPPGVTVSYPKGKLEKTIPKELLEEVKEEKERREYIRVEEE